MKKILLLGLVTVFLIGCGQKTPVNDSIAQPASQDEEKIVSKLDLPLASGSIKVEPKTPSTPEKQVYEPHKEYTPMYQADFPLCKATTNESLKNDCYLSLAYTSSTSWSTDKKDFPVNETCGQIINDSTKSSKCYWLFAMKIKDQTLCNNINSEGDTNYAYLTKDICNQYIKYEKGDVNWSLAGGIPQQGDDGVAYSGHAELTGWMEDISFYGEMVPRFHLTEYSLRDLPLSPFGSLNEEPRNDFDIDTKNTPEVAKYIKENSSEKNPITLVVDQIIYLNEMSPQMHVTLK